MLSANPYGAKMQELYLCWN